MLVARINLRTRGDGRVVGEECQRRFNPFDGSWSPDRHQWRNGDDAQK